MEVHFGGGGTFERGRGRGIVQSRIDFAIAWPDSGWTDEDPVQEYGILPHSRTYYCLLFSLYHMFIVFVISY